MAARQRDFMRVASEAREIEVRDAEVLVLVAGRLRPGQPLAVGRNAILCDGIAKDEVFGLPLLFFRRGLGVVGDGDGRRMNEADDCEQNCAE